MPLYLSDILGKFTNWRTNGIITLGTTKKVNLKLFQGRVYGEKMWAR